VTAAAAVVEVRRERLVREMFRFGRARVGLLLAGSVVAFTIVGPLVIRRDPTAFAGPPYSRRSAALPLGADSLGRDVLARLAVGGRLPLLLGVSAAALGVGLGAVLGMTAATSRSRWSSLGMRAVDVALAFPQMVLALLCLTRVGPKMWLLVAVVAFFHIPHSTRVVRAASLSVAEQDFVAYARSIGISRFRLLTREVFPSVMSTCLVEFGLRLVFSVAILTSLSYLGFGKPPPAADWGRMIYENQSGLTIQPWAVVAPLLLIAMFCVGVNLLVDALSRAAARIDDGGGAS